MVKLNIGGRDHRVAQESEEDQGLCFVTILSQGLISISLELDQLLVNDTLVTQPLGHRNERSHYL